MQNKEIEEDVKELLEFFKFWLVHGWIPAVRIEQVKKLKQMLENILQYIEQLETKVKKSEKDKQKLIEKLEEQANRKIPLAEDGDYVQGHRDLARDLLKIVKGEKE